ncbi:MAG TPA: hypothetical protein VLD37_06405 [Candidatus Bilamarchaeum sp.]|nr:hypothetical protein [Candidatus Bilamarchaeum sp.]
MQTKPSRSKGFLSLDALFCTVPLILISLLMIRAASELSSKAAARMHSQEVFDKLVSVADHTVKSGAAVKRGGVRHPNWIDETKLTQGYVLGLRETAGLSELYVSLDEPVSDFPVCIYRLVVSGEEKALSKLYVCGG